jgi:hypothetical protein
MQVDVLYEGTVDEVITKEKTHPLGIKVRVVGGKIGRVVAIMSTGDNSIEVASSLGVRSVVPVDKNRGVRSQLLAQHSAASKGWTPYAIAGDVWIPKGPASEALEQLVSMGLLDEISASAKIRTSKGIKNGGSRKYGEAGIRKMRRVVENQERKPQQDFKLLKKSGEKEV